MRRVTILGLVLIFCAILASSAAHWDPVATFSILGFDPETGEIGGAVQSRVFSVGNGVLWAEAGVGAAATQAIVDVSYGPGCGCTMMLSFGSKSMIIRRRSRSCGDWSKKAPPNGLALAPKCNRYSLTGPML